MICPYCRSEIDDGAVRCPSCSTWLNDAARREQAFPWWMIVAGVALLLFIAWLRATTAL